MGLVAGAAWQVTQPALWRAESYAGLLLAALALGAAVWIAQRRAHRSVVWLLCALAAGLAMAAGCGARALAFQAQALDIALEGQDLRLTGIIAAMPEPAPWGTRFRFAVEHAQRAGKKEARPGRPVVVPPLVELSWPGARAGDRAVAQAPLKPGERWELSARLKAPHGLRNPHGFDQELWLWEQGVQATGYVRLGRAQARPQRLAQTGRHPVARLRQQLRDAIVAPQDAQPAWQRARGVVAALVVGDQNAIAAGYRQSSSTWNFSLESAFGAGCLTISSTSVRGPASAEFTKEFYASCDLSATWIGWVFGG